MRKAGSSNVRKVSHFYRSLFLGTMEGNPGEVIVRWV
jgi:hypothetical protein